MREGRSLRDLREGVGASYHRTEEKCVCVCGITKTSKFHSLSPCVHYTAVRAVLSACCTQSVCVCVFPLWVCTQFDVCVLYDKRFVFFFSLMHNQIVLSRDKSVTPAASALSDGLSGTFRL